MTIKEYLKYVSLPLICVLFAAFQWRNQFNDPFYVKYWLYCLFSAFFFPFAKTGVEMASYKITKQKTLMPYKAHRRKLFSLYYGFVFIFAIPCGVLYLLSFMLPKKATK